MTTEPPPLRPSGLLGTPAGWEVADAIGRGLPLDLTDEQFMAAAIDGGFTDTDYVERNHLPLYRAHRREAQTGEPF